MYPDYDTRRLTGPYLDIHTAREEQKADLGAEEHTLQEWVLDLVENVGHLAEAVREATRDEDGQLGTVRAEAVRTSAGLVALLEYVDSLQSSTP